MNKSSIYIIGLHPSWRTCPCSYLLGAGGGRQADQLLPATRNRNHNGAIYLVAQASADDVSDRLRDRSCRLQLALGG